MARLQLSPASVFQQSALGKNANAIAAGHSPLLKPGTQVSPSSILELLANRLLASAGATMP